MDVTLILSLLILASLYWLHRRALDRAYAAGRAAALADQDKHERHGLASLPAEEQRP
jgi:hypothetical protein